MWMPQIITPFMSSEQLFSAINNNSMPINYFSEHDECDECDQCEQKLTETLQNHINIRNRNSCVANNCKECKSFPHLIICSKYSHEETNLYKSYLLQLSELEWFPPIQQDSKIIVNTFPCSEVKEGNKSTFNTNNLWHSLGVEPPLDYLQKSNECGTRKWIDLFAVNYKVIILDENDLVWMKKAFNVALQSGKFSSLFEEELEMTCKKHKFPTGKYFVRNERCSLKYGMYGVGPYDSLENIIKSTITTSKEHFLISEDDKFCKYYLIEWKEMEKDKEFRVFIHENKITSISQQFLFQANKWLSKKNKLEIEQVAKDIISFFELEVKAKMAFLRNYVFDVVLCGDKFYFIEANPFGANYSSGSSLFHWVNDDAQLTSNGSCVEFRYTID